MLIIFILGPNLPFKSCKLAMVTSPTGKGVIVMPRIGKDMFELSDSMVWTKLKQTLQINHGAGILAIPIPKELVYEKITKNVEKI